MSVPTAIIRNASYERMSLNEGVRAMVQQVGTTETQIRTLIEALNALHPDEMSPRDALEALYALKAKLPKQ